MRCSTESERGQGHESCWAKGRAVDADRLLRLRVATAVAAGAIRVDKTAGRAEQAERCAAASVSNHRTRHAAGALTLASRGEADADLVAQSSGWRTDLVRPAVRVAGALVARALVVWLLLDASAERGDRRQETGFAHALAVEAVAANVRLRPAARGLDDGVLADAVATGVELDATGCLWA